mgnify:CR=1 FL=1
MINAKDNALKNLSADVSRLSASLINPDQYIKLKENKFANKILSLEQGINSLIEQKTYEFGLVSVKLESVSFQRVLDRGFALVTDHRGEPILSASSAKPGMNIGIKFSDGEISGSVLDTGKLLTKRNKSQAKRLKNKDKDIEPQGSLL